MLTLHRKNGLYLNNAANKGRGVFCTEDIAKGDVIEIAPVFIFKEEDAAHVSKTLIADYVFSCKISDSLCAWFGIKDPKNMAVCLSAGALSFCNHLPAPNAEVVWREDGNSLFSVLQALRDIPKDTEIGISYGGSWFATRNFPGRK